MTTVVNIREREPDDVFIGRPSKYGNPFVMRSGQGRTEVIAKFEAWWYAPEQGALREDALGELKDKRLVCFCKPHNCHGDVIAAFVNETLGG